MNLRITEVADQTVSPDIMDKFLLPLLNARNEQDRQERLDELLRIHVAPIIRQVLRQRLNLYVSVQGVNEKNHDAEDLYQEAMTRMVKILLANHRSLIEIENFEGYVVRVVSNICADYLRKKSPTRARLKDGLRDIFRRHQDLVSWQYEDETLCGFAIWRNTGKRVDDIDDVDTRSEAFLSTRFADKDVRILPLARIVAEIFDWIGGPIQIDVLAGMLVHILDLRERQIESFDDQAANFEVKFAGSTWAAELHLETNEMLERLWYIVKRLPPKQRDAFVLRFQDQAGRNFFTVLLTAGIADTNELAEGLGRSAPEITRLRLQTPMDSQTAALELNTSRKNVNKWRFLAIRKLKAELGI